MQTALAFRAGLCLLLFLGTGCGKARISDSASSLDNFDFPEPAESFYSTNDDDNFVVVLQTSVGW